jgi:predicted CopG family antitoxin
MNVENVERHTITLNKEAFENLKAKGKFGESYSDLIMRVLNNSHPWSEREVL